MPKNKFNLTFSVNSKYRGIINDPCVTRRLNRNIEHWLEENKRKNYFKASRYWKYYILGWVLGVICLLIPIILFVFETSTHCEYEYSIFIAFGAEWILLNLAHKFHNDCPYNPFKKRI